MINSFRLYLLREVILLLSFLDEASWLAAFFFFSSILKISSHSFLGCYVAAEKSTLISVGVSLYVRNLCSLDTFKTLCFDF